MEDTLRPLDAFYCLTLTDCLFGSFALFRGIPPEIQAQVVSVRDYFYAQCKELDPYGEGSRT